MLVRSFSRNKFDILRVFIFFSARIPDEGDFESHVREQKRVERARKVEIEIRVRHDHDGKLSRRCPLSQRLPRLDPLHSGPQKTRLVLHYRVLADRDAHASVEQDQVGAKFVDPDLSNVAIRVRVSDRVRLRSRSG